MSILQETDADYGLEIKCKILTVVILAREPI